VHGGPLVVDALNVFHDVDLADARPAPEVAAIGLAQHPEGGPVSARTRARDVGHLQPRLDAQLAAGRRLEVGAPGLDAARGPVAGAIALRRDLRLPAPSSETLLVEEVMVSTSPVPKLAGPPG